jgi:hypothetical protein
MTTAQVSKPIVEPTLIETLQALKADIFKNMNCVKPGQIQSFNAARNTVTVQILFKRLLGDGVTILDYPILVDCPVFTLQGGGGYIQFPIAAGDQCLVLFADNNIDAWFNNGAAAVPFDDRTHDLSDGIALVGMNSLASSMPAYQANKLVISYGGAAITFASGQISFDGTSGEATITAIGNLVKIANATTTLLTLLNGLIDVIAATTVQGPSTTYPLTAATIAAMEAYKLQLATLLL